VCIAELERSLDEIRVLGLGECASGDGGNDQCTAGDEEWHDGRRAHQIAEHHIPEHGTNTTHGGEEAAGTTTNDTQIESIQRRLVCCISLSTLALCLCFLCSPECRRSNLSMV
jgi:hypothetical protein